MPKFIIERDIPGVSNFTPAHLKDMAKKSCEVISKMGSQIQWLHSYVTGNKVYSVFIAPNKELIQEHARQGGIPANVVSLVTTIIDPTTAD
jgi:Protein of unknown function (DUF4242)